MLFWTTAAMAGGLALGDTLRWAEDVTLPSEGVETTLHRGLVFAVVDGEGAEVGFAFVGSATLVGPVDPRTAATVANALVARGADPASLAGQLQGSWTETLDVVVGLGEAPPWDETVASLPRVVADQRSVAYVGEDGMEHVVVSAYDPGGARDLARRTLAARVDALAAAGLDPERALALDRADVAPVRWVLEGRSARDREWWTVARDGGGQVGAHDVGTLGFVAGAERRWIGRWGGPTADPRISRATANVVVEADPTGVANDVHVEAVVHVATAADTRVVVLSVPRRPSETRQGVAPVPSTFEITEVALTDGTPLERLGAPFGVVPVDPEEASVDAWRLPAVLAAGDTVRLRVKVQDRWPASFRIELPEWGVAELMAQGICSNPKQCSAMVAEWPQFAELGRVVTGRAVVPTVPGRPGSFPAEVRVGTTRSGGWNASIGGDVEVLPLGDGRWWVAHTRGDAEVAFGQLHEVVASGALGLPDVRFLSHGPANDLSETFVRSVIHFYQGFLPDYPYASVDVVEGASDPLLGRFSLPAGSGTQIAENTIAPPGDGDEGEVGATSSPGVVVLRGLLEVGDSGPTSVENSLDSERPHHVERGVAEALASHWWARPAYEEADAWIGPAATALYRDLFVTTAWGDEVAATWRANEPSAAPVRVLDAVRRRVGDRAFLGGMDAFLAGEPTTAALERSLEATSRVELDGFFDLFLRGGLEPRVDGTFAVGRDGVKVDLATDLPFGAFEVPVVVSLRGGGARTTWVRIADGAGSAWIEDPGRVRAVELDPHGWLPVRGQLRPAEPAPAN